MLAVYITPEAERIAVMLFISAVAHVFLIYAVGFVPPSPKNGVNPPIRIILVQSSTEKEPKEADFFAQANQDGGGDSEKDEPPATPTIAPFPDEALQIIAMPPPESRALPTQEVDVEKLAVQHPSTHQVESSENVLSPEKTAGQGETRDEEILTEVPVTNTLNAEIQTTLASIQAELDAFTEARAKRPRKSYSHTRAKEKIYARYMEAWRIKAERIGTAYYRQEAKRNPFSGALNVQVAINHDGTILSVEITRFLEEETTLTRRQFLEEAVRRIVHLTAPFNPFPEGMRKETDIFYMTYHWDFKHGESVIRNADL